MPHVTFTTKDEAQAFCDTLDKALGIPPEGLPGIGGDGRTYRWAEPQPLKDGSFAVAVPRKGMLADFLERVEPLAESGKLNAVETILEGAGKLEPMGAAEQPILVDGEAKPEALDIAGIIATIQTAKEIAPEDRANET